MKIIIETTRFKLREFELSDAPGMKRLNDAVDVERFTGDTPFADVNGATEFIKHYDHYKLYGFGRWSIIDKVDNTFAGWCGLKYSPELDEVDIGFRIDPERRGEGIATETAKAVLDYGFDLLKIKRVVARVIDTNEASLRVINKLGMSYYGSKDDDTGRWLLYEKFNV